MHASGHDNESSDYDPTDSDEEEVAGGRDLRVTKIPTNACAMEYITGPHMIAFAQVCKSASLNHDCQEHLLSILKRIVAYDRVQNRIDTFNDKLDWDEFSANKFVTFEHILNNPLCPWNWQSISWNPNITFDFIMKNPQYPWDYRTISSNINVTLQDVMDHPEIQWDWYSLCDDNSNIKITYQFYLDNIDSQDIHAIGRAFKRNDDASIDDMIELL